MDGRPGMPNLFQGNHAGVEFATEAHQNMLQGVGLLPHPRHGRILGLHSLSVDGPWQGLCIDDLFAISAERSSSVRAPRSEGIIRRAKTEYAQQGVPGSDEKDVWGARVFTAI